MKEDSLELTTGIMNVYLLSLAKKGGGGMMQQHTHALIVIQDMIVDYSNPPSSSSSPSTLRYPPHDVIAFNTVLLTCVNTGNYKAAQALLDQMNNGMFAFPASTNNDNGSGRGQQQQKNGNDLIEIRPDIVSYNTVIYCATPKNTVLPIQQMILTRHN